MNLPPLPPLPMPDMTMPSVSLAPRSGHFYRASTVQDYATAAVQAALAQQRQPLSDKQILEIGVECGVIEENWSEAEIEFARAVEAAHDIKETK